MSGLVFPLPPPYPFEPLYEVVYPFLLFSPCFLLFFFPLRLISFFFNFPKGEGGGGGEKKGKGLFFLEREGKFKKKKRTMTAPDIEEIDAVRTEWKHVRLLWIAQRDQTVGASLINQLPSELVLRILSHLRNSGIVLYGKCRKGFVHTLFDKRSNRLQFRLRYSDVPDVDAAVTIRYPLGCAPFASSNKLMLLIEDPRVVSYLIALEDSNRKFAQKMSTELGRQLVYAPSYRQINGRFLLKVKIDRTTRVMLLSCGSSMRPVSNSVLRTRCRACVTLDASFLWRAASTMAMLLKATEVIVISSAPHQGIVDVPSTGSVCA